MRSSQRISVRQPSAIDRRQQVGAGRFAEADRRAVFGLAARGPGACRRGSRRARRRRSRAGCPRAGRRPGVDHSFACVRQQKTASSKSPTMANDSAVRRTGTQSSSQSSRRAGAPKAASALAIGVTSAPRASTCPFVGEQRRGAIEHRAGGPRQHREPEQRREHLPVGIEQRALDREPGDLLARQLGGDAAAPQRERAARLSDVRGFERGTDLRERVAEAAKAHQQIQNAPRSRRAPAAGAPHRAPRTSPRRSARAGPAPRPSRSRPAARCRRRACAPAPERSGRTPARARRASGRHATARGPARRGWR